MTAVSPRSRALSAAALALAAGSASAQISNGGFETGTLSGWTIAASAPAPVVSSTVAHSGTHSAFLGSVNPAPEPNGDGAMYQNFTVPSAGLALTFWYQTYTTDSITFDWQDAYIQNSAGTATLATIFHLCQNADWNQAVVSLDPWVGQTIRIKFLVHQDGFGDDTSMNVDDVAVGTAPPMGACCLSGLGGCSVTTSGSCTSQGGTYRGDGVTCAAANCPGPTPGPDVIVGEVWDIGINGAVGATTAYSVGTDSCNLGTQGVTWVSSNNQHPVITSNLFRLKTVA